MKIVKNVTEVCLMLLHHLYLFYLSDIKKERIKYIQTDNFIGRIKSLTLWFQFCEILMKIENSYSVLKYISHYCH